MTDTTTNPDLLNLAIALYSCLRRPGDPSWNHLRADQREHITVLAGDAIALAQCWYEPPVSAVEQVIEGKAVKA